MIFIPPKESFSIKLTSISNILLHRPLFEKKPK